MTNQQALCMEAADAGALGRVRQQTGIEVCRHADAIWLRVQEVSEELELELRKLPGTHYSVLPDGQLLPSGKRTPQGRLPQETWTPLSRWMSIEIDAPALCGTLSERVPLQIVRGHPTGEANVLLLPLDAWQSYAVNAPQVRLDRLTFAANRVGSVVVRGNPLPALPGVRYVERSGIAVESGWTWSPPVDPHVVREMLELATGDLAIIYAVGSWDLVRGDDFVRTTRSAVRQTCEALVHG